MKKNLYTNKEPTNLAEEDMIALEEEIYRRQWIHSHGFKPGEYEEISQAKTLWGNRVSKGQVKKE